MARGDHGAAVPPLCSWHRSLATFCVCTEASALRGHRQRSCSEVMHGGRRQCSPPLPVDHGTHPCRHSARPCRHGAHPCRHGTQPYRHDLRHGCRHRTRRRTRRRHRRHRRHGQAHLHTRAVTGSPATNAATASHPSCGGDTRRLPPLWRFSLPRPRLMARRAAAGRQACPHRDTQTNRHAKRQSCMCVRARVSGARCLPRWRRTSSLGCMTRWRCSRTGTVYLARAYCAARKGDANAAPLRAPLNCRSFR